MVLEQDLEEDLYAEAGVDDTEIEDFSDDERGVPLVGAPLRAREKKTWTLFLSLSMSANST
eukprot:scaffold29318_cov65-Attheya_sp.AAC.3